MIEVVDWAWEMIDPTIEKEEVYEELEPFAKALSDDDKSLIEPLI